MKKMQTVDLKDIYIRAYSKLPSDDQKFVSLEDYKRNNRKQLEAWCKNLGICLFNFNQKKAVGYERAFRTRKYDIPVILAPLLIAVLRSDGSIGQYISLIRTGKQEKITYEQKLEFIKIYEEELFDSKEYASISDEEIKSMVDMLRSSAEQSKNVNEFVKEIDSGILTTIRRDIYNINKINEYSEVALPQLGWLRNYVRVVYKNEPLFPSDFSEDGCPNRDSMPECSNILCKERAHCDDNDCAWREVCNKCSIYNHCNKRSKTNPFFDSVIKDCEREYFTTIYIGMLKKAHERFYDFLSEYKDVTDGYFASSCELPQDIESNVEKNLVEALFNSDAQFDKHIESSTLKKLEENGIVERN